MGAVEDRMDARAEENFRLAFGLSLMILNRKGSKRLMAAEVEECLNDLEALEKLSLLPPNFTAHSVYGKRDTLNQIRMDPIISKEE